MHDMVDELYTLCETLERDLKKTNERLKMAGGKMSASDLEYVDKLTHSIKSVKATIAMAEAEDDDYSNEGGGSNRGSYARGSYRGGSYARGRRNARRDSMGRYSRESGYSRADFRDTLEEAMENAPDEQTRMKIERMMQEM